MKISNKSRISLISIMLLVLTLCGCSGKSKDDSDSAANDVNIPCIEMGAHVIASVTTQEELAKTGFSVYSFGDSSCERLLTNYVGMDESTYSALEDAFIYMPDEATADEIIILKAKSTEQASDCLEQHRSSRENDFYGYFPEEADKLENTKVVQKGSYVALLVGKDSSSYSKAFDELFEAGYASSDADASINKLLAEKAGKSDMYAGADDGTATDTEDTTEVTTATATEATTEATTEITTEATTEATTEITTEATTETTTEATTEITTETTTEITTEATSEVSTEATIETTTEEDKESTSRDKIKEDLKIVVTDSNRKKAKMKFLAKWNKIVADSGNDDYDESVLSGVSSQTWITDNGVLVLDDYSSYSIYDVEPIVNAYKTGNDKKLTKERDKVLLQFCKDFVDCYIDDDMTDFEKELEAFDFILSWAHYDETELYYGEWFKLYSNEPYGCLVKKTAICNGFSSAFKLLLNVMDIDCEALLGYVKSDWVYHSWNKVKLSDNNWYNVDITWCLSRDKSYFNRSDDYFYQTQHYEGNTPSPAAKGGKFEGYPENR